MDEARRVLDRLERIDALRGQGAAPGELLAELRALVREGEQWSAAERTGTSAARTALDVLDRRLAVCEASVDASTAGRGVVAREPG
jgi:hypothetical protein